MKFMKVGEIEKEYDGIKYTDTLMEKKID